MSNLSAVEQFRKRLRGGLNRTHWGAEDVHRIAKRFGLVERDLLPSVPSLPVRVVPRTVGDTGNTFDYTATLSTPHVDRMGDTVAVSGWKLDQFRANPIIFYGHESSALPVGKAPKVWI